MGRVRNSTSGVQGQRTGYPPRDRIGDFDSGHLKLPPYARDNNSRLEQLTVRCRGILSLSWHNESRWVECSSI